MAYKLRPELTENNQNILLERGIAAQRCYPNRNLSNWLHVRRERQGRGKDGRSDIVENCRLFDMPEGCSVYMSLVREQSNAYDNNDMTCFYEVPSSQSRYLSNVIIEYDVATGKKGGHA